MSTADGLRDWAKQCGINGHAAEQAILDAAADELEQRSTKAAEGNAFLDEIRAELVRIADSQAKLSADTERVVARLAGKWPV